MIGRPSTVCTLPTLCPLAGPIVKDKPIIATLPALSRRRLLQAGLPLLVGLHPALPLRTALASPLKDDESVLAIPGILKVNERGPMQAQVQIWVHEDERRPGIRGLFARYLGIDTDTLDEARLQIYQKRTGLFLKDSERGKRLSVHVPGGSQVPLPASDRDGRSSAFIELPRSVWNGSAGPLRYAVQGCRGSTCSSLLWPVTPQGLSIVSDIDDTIKISGVGDTKRLLRNTFVEDFKPVPGMADWYRQLHERSGGRVRKAVADADAASGASAGARRRTDAGQDRPVGSASSVRPRLRTTCFHYLSSSPLQLLPVLEAFLHEQGFPAGTMHLRESTGWRSLLPGKGDSEAHKLGQLRQLLGNFPQRHFILVGDSGEADPEIYAEVAREHPRQVRAIFIRDVTDEPATAERYQRTFVGVPEGRWHIIRDGRDGAARLSSRKALKG